MLRTPSFRIFLSVFVLLFFVYPNCKGQVNPKDVTIIRDTFGVPHIYGITDADAAYGLAWAHSEDDFEHIQHNILTGKRMLGEVLGKEGVLFDFGLQLLSIDSLVDTRYELDLSPDYRKVSGSVYSRA
jgi:acyl-homoserine-lactone acylase